MNGKNDRNGQSVRGQARFFRVANLKGLLSYVGKKDY